MVSDLSNPRPGLRHSDPFYSQLTNMMDINGYISYKNLKILSVILGQFPIMLEKKIQETDLATLQVQPKMTRMGTAMFPLLK